MARSLSRPASAPAPRPGRGPGRPAIDETLVLSATRRLILSVGMDRVTTQAIADEAGVAKASIYRRWPSRGVLLVEALFVEMAEGIGLNEDAAPADAIVSHILNRARGLRGQHGPSLRAAIAECILDPAGAAALREYYVKVRQVAIRIIQRGMDEGVFAGGGTAEQRQDELYGALFYRFFLQLGELSVSEVRGLVEDVLVRSAR